MMTSSVVKKANIAGDDVCSLENQTNSQIIIHFMLLIIYLIWTPYLVLLYFYFIHGYTWEG